MNGATTGSRSHEHRRAAELLPWYVNDTLDGPELDLVTRHLERCAPCRLDLARERRLAHALRTSEELAFPAERGLAKLHARLDAGEQPTRDGGRRGGPLERLRAIWAGLSGPGRWVLAAQLVVVLTLGVALLQPPEPPDPAAPGTYRTLSSVSEVPTSGAQRFRIVFEDSSSEADVRALLLATEARIVDGPTPFGVYTLESLDAEETLETLRSSPLVTFVEPGANPTDRKGRP